MPFWRDAPLSDAERDLIDLLFEAHEKAARRANLSATAIKQGAQAGVPFTQAIIAGLATLGGSHGPVERTYDFYNEPDIAMAVYRCFAAGQKVPGFGSSFRKDDDPQWAHVKAWFEKHRPDLAGLIRCARCALKVHGKDLAPNPASYTALTAIALGIPRDIASWLFVSARLSAWAETYLVHADGASAKPHKVAE